MDLLAGFILIVLLVVGFFIGVGKGPLAQNRARHNRPSRSRTNELGSGDLARKAHIVPWLQVRSPLSTALPVSDVRGSDGIACRKGALNFPLVERNRHILVVAKTGSGKTTRAILPVLYEDCLCPVRSTIVIDSKPEMWDKLAGLAQQYNPKKKLLLFNPLDTSRSLSWNILAKIETDTDAKLIANTIVTATDNPTARADSPFFRNSALQLLNSMMVGILTDKSERLSMPRVHEILNSGISNLCDWIEAHPHALRNSKTFVDLARSGSQNADTILSELSTRLAAWDLSVIRASTSFDELDLESLINEPCLLVVELRESELEMLRPLANVIVIELLRYLTKRAEQMPGQTLPRPVSLVIDEFASSLGRLPEIHVKLNTLRSRNVSIVAAIQSIAQIKANYDRDADSVLAGFSTKIFMPSLDFMDAEWASKETGTMTVRFNVASIGKNRRIIDFFAHRNDNLQEQVQQRAVLTPDEIGRPTDNAATFFLPNTPVFQGHLIPYYELSDVRAKFDRGKNAEVRLRNAPIEIERMAELEPQAVGKSVEPKAPEPPAAPARDPHKNGANGADESEDTTRMRAMAAAETAPSPAHAPVTASAPPMASSYTGTNGGSASLAAAAPVHSEPAPAPPPAPAPSAPTAPAQPRSAGGPPTTLVELKNALGFGGADRATKDWWLGIEQKNRADHTPLISLLQQVWKRRITLGEFYKAYAEGGQGTGRRDMKEVLQALDKQLLLRDRAKFGFEAAPEEARTWWESFEQVNEHDLLSVRELLGELVRRNVNLTDFYQLYLGSTCNSLVDLLKIVDEHVLAREAALRGETVNRADVAHAGG